MVKQMSHSDENRYTNPELRDRIKAKITEGDKGGKPGQWSARKAQMVAHEYEQQGGGYKQVEDKQQKSLKQWGDEHWKTEDGKKAQREGGTARYLPEKAWESLSKEERAATDKKKREGSKQGKQFVANTKEAAAARKTATAKKSAATKKSATKKDGLVAKKSASSVASSKKGTAKKNAAVKTDMTHPRAAAKTSATKKASIKKATTKKSGAGKIPVAKAPAKKTSTKKSAAGKGATGK